MNNNDGPWHAGEVALQTRAGVHERLSQVGRVVQRDQMPDQHRELFDKLPTLLVAALDATGQPWATMLAGAPGFVATPDAQHMRVSVEPDSVDPVLALLRPHAAVGVLGLEPHTRRRNRMNGDLVERHRGGFTIRVRQSFGNCPKYIQAREPMWQARAAAPARHLDGALPAAARELIARADTLFVASTSGAAPGAGRAEGVDISHRGGLPGFVQAQSAADGAITLRWVEQVGNFFFNTLGNLVLHPKAGLLFVDHERGDLLHLAVSTEVDTGDALAVRCRVQSGWWRPAALPLRWTAARFAPQFESALNQAAANQA
ncbi:MAG: pyridoxamine 5'-phosphate oxidase family protein [Burkholderiales bacterium]|nr:pyridoxamine 5'-phosphate oxidase family protein [Burkholderiales bacterium]